MISRFMESRNKPPEYKKAVDAIKELLQSGKVPGHGLDLASRAFAEATEQAWLDSFKRDYKPIIRRTTHVCWRRLIHGRCKCNVYPYEVFPNPPQDHIGEFTNEAGDRFIISQPYDLDWQEVLENVEYCKKHGLEFHIYGNSWHFPSRTMLIVYRKQKEKE